MTLKELQKMIKEEFTAYQNEAEDEVDVSVSDNDIDAEMGDEEMGGEEEAAGEEDVLRSIFDLLKTHFEGGEEEAPEEAPEDVEGGMPAPPTGPPTGPPPADLEEWRGKNDKTVTRGSKSSSGPNAGYKKEATTRGHTGFGDAKKESLQEVKRMQKLANIIK